MIDFLIGLSWMMAQAFIQLFLMVMTAGVALAVFLIKLLFNAIRAWRRRS